MSVHRIRIPKRVYRVVSIHVPHYDALWGFTKDIQIFFPGKHEIRGGKFLLTKINLGNLAAAGISLKFV